MRRSTALSLRAVLPAAAIALVPALYGLAPHADAADTEAEPRSGTGADTRPGAAAVAAPVCGSQGSTEFPIAARLHDGPDRYARGGGWRTWHLELRNTTDTGCRAVHPIAVLVDRARALRPEDIGFEFLDRTADGGTWRPVSFETTDQDENLGVFDDQFAGFTVPAGKTVDVPVRTRFGAAASSGKVTANVIAVQRREDDGDWVGQSNAYEFSVGDTDASGGTDGTDGTGSDATTPPKDPGGTDPGVTGGTGDSSGTADPGGKVDPGSTGGSADPGATGGTADPGGTGDNGGKVDSGGTGGTSDLGGTGGTADPGATGGTGDSSGTADPGGTVDPGDTSDTPDTGGTADTDATANPDDTKATAAPRAPSTRGLTPPRVKPSAPSPSPSASSGSGSDSGTVEESPAPVPPSTDTGTENGDDTVTTPEDSGTDAGTDGTGDDEDTGVSIDPETDTGVEDPGTTDPGLEDPGATEPGDTGDTGTGTEDPATEDPGLEDPGTEDPDATEPGDTGDTGTGTEDPGLEDPGTTDPGDTGDTGTGDTGTGDTGTGDTGTGDDGGYDKGGQEDGDHQSHHRPPELAETGRGAVLAGLGALSVALLTGGTVLLVKSRRTER
ncbi:hypothetical protein [Streptomyces cucumeris]|uniref:hypothetical protein n=1 Tax=Streptomyces cucumeris TaxID=2962890 RepID=UPI003EBA8C42